MSYLIKIIAISFSFFCFVAIGGSLGQAFAKHFAVDEKTYTLIGAILGFIFAIAIFSAIFIWLRLQFKKEVRRISSLVDADQITRKRVEKKIGRMLRQFKRIRSYDRRIIGIGDFTPIIRVRRYVKPTPELLGKIDILEQSIISHIARYRDERAVDEALSKATEVSQGIIRQLDQVK